MQPDVSVIVLRHNGSAQSLAQCAASVAANARSSGLAVELLLVDNATSDNPVDSALSLYVAPLLLLAGFVGVAGAVLWGAPRDAAPADGDTAEAA